MNSHISARRKKAVIKLIPKSSAQADPSDPGNFCPIASSSFVDKDCWWLVFNIRQA
jgi:hypothetical protein